MFPAFLARLRSPSLRRRRFSQRPRSPMRPMGVEKHGRCEAGMAASKAIAATGSICRSIKTVPRGYGPTPVGGDAMLTANGSRQSINDEISQILGAVPLTIAAVLPELSCFETHPVVSEKEDRLAPLPQYPRKAASTSLHCRLDSELPKLAPDRSRLSLVHVFGCAFTTMSHELCN
jgi:hypothetical protein